MTTSRRQTPAVVYDQKFVPALFGPWGPVVVAAAGVGPGQSVLDVACGTGAATLAARDIAGPGGRVVGLDANPDMLAVARRKAADVTWQQGVAEDLPFDDAEFDAAISQFGIMFFDDRAKALAEMMRILTPGGCLAVAVCGAIDRSPGYATFARLLDRLFGEAVGDAFRAPFVLGDADVLRQIAAEAGLTDYAVEERSELVRFRTIDDLVSTERACVWTLGGILDDDQFERLRQECGECLRPFANGDGRVSFAMPALILTAGK